MSDQFLEQWINIKFCVKLRKLLLVLSVWSQKQTTKFAIETADIPHKPRKLALKSQIMTIFITFLDMKGTVNFELIPQS